MRRNHGLDWRRVAARTASRWHRLLRQRHTDFVLEARDLDRPYQPVHTRVMIRRECGAQGLRDNSAYADDARQCLCSAAGDNMTGALMLRQLRGAVATTSTKAATTKRSSISGKASIGNRRPDLTTIVALPWHLCLRRQRYSL